MGIENTWLNLSKWLLKRLIWTAVIIHWSEEDHGFIAEVPELPGCAADGQTPQEALVTSEIVIQDWLETAKELGRPIPQPKGRLVYA